jgi:hypothetical protein
MDDADVEIVQIFYTAVFSKYQDPRGMLRKFGSLQNGFGLVFISFMDEC